MGWHLAWQLVQLDTGNPEACLRLFRSNRNAGLLPVPFLAAAILL
jgi:4-hydroxybenzoate polyprenyltransferase